MLNISRIKVSLILAKLQNFLLQNIIMMEVTGNGRACNQKALIAKYV